MKKVVFFKVLLFLLVWGTVDMSAQVTIGKDAPPHSGAILDLSQGDRDWGLLLPNIALSDVNILQVVDNSESNFAVKKSEAKGMIVYNTSSSTIGGNGMGLYIWDGDRWRALSVSGGTMKITPTTIPPVSIGGGSTGTIIANSPAAEGFKGNYNFTMILGEDYAEVNPPAAADGKFSVTFYPNNTAVSRKAVVLVTGPVGNTATFIFTQEADLSLCDASGTHNPVVTQTGKLGSNGAVYFSVAAEPNVDYVWTRNGIEVSSGASYIATRPGNYVVYGGVVGCTHHWSVTLNSSGDAPDPLLSIASNNGGIICGSTPVTLTALGVSSGDKLSWFKDGVLLANQTAASIQVSTPGNYFAAVKSGDLYSHPSNTLTIVSGGNNSQVPLNPDDVKVNGIPIHTFNSYCRGSSLVLTVDNQQAGITYTWYNGNDVIKNTNSYVVPANQNDILLRLVATDNSEHHCPAEVNSTKKTIGSEAPERPYISGDNQLCSGQNTNLTVGSANNAISFEWYKDDEFYSSTTDNFINITLAGNYKVRYKSGVCLSDFSSVFIVNGQGAPTIGWDQFVTQVNNTSTYPFSVRSTGISAPTAYIWTATANGISTAQDLSAVTGNSVNLDFSGEGSIRLTVTPMNGCGQGSPITKDITMNNTTLSAPKVSPNGTIHCGGVNFKIEKPDKWTASQWSAFNLSNITSATLDGKAYPNGTLTSDGIAYYYYIAASSATLQTANITIGGSIGSMTVLPATAQVQVQANAANKFSILGANCFDMNRSNASERTKANFSINYTYSLSGTLDNGIDISDVVWTYSDPKSAVQAFTPAPTSSTLRSNQVTVKYDPALLTDVTINASGIMIILTATITTTGGSCPNAVYTAEFPIRIKNASCCPGVVIIGGVHDSPAAMDSIGDLTYDKIIKVGFSRDASKNLCVYYRDAPSTMSWQAAMDKCADDSNVDPEDKSMGWRLPNIAELGQMNPNTSASWSPKYDALDKVSTAKAGTTNLVRNFYWSSTTDVKGYAYIWSYMHYYTTTSPKTLSNRVRCVMTMQ